MRYVFQIYHKNSIKNKQKHEPHENLPVSIGFARYLNIALPNEDTSGDIITLLIPMPHRVVPYIRIY